MKHKLYLLLALILALNITGCNGDIVDTEKESISETEKLNEIIDSETEETTETNDDYDKLLPRILSWNYSHISFCIDAPALSVGEEGSCKYAPMESYFVTYDCYLDPSSELLFEVDLSKINDETDVIEGMSKQFIRACTTNPTHCLIMATEYSFTITNKEKVQINGYDMCKFKGYFELYSKYTAANPNYLEYDKADFVGYSVLLDGYPIYFAVVDIPTINNGENIENIADRVAKTLREYDPDAKLTH